MMDHQYPTIKQGVATGQLMNLTPDYVHITGCTSDPGVVQQPPITVTQLNSLQNYDMESQGWIQAADVMNTNQSNGSVEDYVANGGRFNVSQGVYGDLMHPDPAGDARMVTINVSQLSSEISDASLIHIREIIRSSISAEDAGTIEGQDLLMMTDLRPNYPIINPQTASVVDELSIQRFDNEHLMMITSQASAAANVLGNSENDTIEGFPLHQMNRGLASTNPGMTNDSDCTFPDIQSKYTTSLIQIEPMSFSVDEASQSSRESSLMCSLCPDTLVGTQRPGEQAIPNQVFVCVICKTSFDDAQSLHSHLINHTLNDLLSCQKCNKVFLQKCDYDVHLQEHRNDATHPCAICFKTFASIDLKLQHELTEHWTLARAYRCHRCAAQFTDKKSLDTHVMSHGVYYKCLYCEQGFLEQHLLNNHLQSHQTVCKYYECLVCKQRFLRADDYERHSLIHSGRTLYSCNVCAKSFARVHNLTQHQLVHKKEPTYKCHYCEVSFPNVRTYDCHMMLHVENKDSRTVRRSRGDDHKAGKKCRLCPRIFVNASELREHVVAEHKGEDNHRCLFCKREFSRKNRLLEHMLVHSASTTHICDICKIGFPKKELLEAHSLTHGKKNVARKPNDRKTISRKKQHTNVVDTNSKESMISTKQQNRAIPCHTKITKNNQQNRNSFLDKHFQPVADSRPYKQPVCHSNNVTNKTDGKYTQLSNEHGLKSTFGKKTTSVIKCKEFFQSSGIKTTPLLTHICPVCGLAYSRLLNLTKHMHKHKDVSAMETSIESNNDVHKSEHFNTTKNDIPVISGDRNVIETDTEASAIVSIETNHDTLADTVADTSYVTQPSDNDVLSPTCDIFDKSETHTKCNETLPHDPDLRQYDGSQTENSTDTNEDNNADILSSISIDASMDNLFMNQSNESLSSDAGNIPYNQPEPLDSFIPSNNASNSLDSILKIFSPVLSNCVGSEDTIASSVQNGVSVKTTNDATPLQSIAPSVTEVDFHVSLKEAVQICEEIVNNDTISEDDLNESMMNLVNGPSNDEIAVNNAFGEINNEIIIISPDGSNFTAQPSPFECCNCKKSYASNASLQCHSITHLCNNNFPCRQCDKVFSRFIDLRKHESKHANSTPHVCDVCGKKYTEKKNLRQHMLSHGAQAAFECATCKKRFIHKCDHEKHVRQHYANKEFRCEYCTRSFTSNPALKQHMISHTGTGDFECSFCNKKFATRSFINQHLKCHLGVRPYRCTWCEKRFARKAQLDSHVTSHTGQGDHQCSFCPRGFSAKWQLKLHLDTHAARGRHECPFCGWRCSRKEQLITHVKKHIQAQVHKCDVCHKTFPWRNHLTRHMDTHERQQDLSQHAIKARFQQQSANLQRAMNNMARSRRTKHVNARSNRAEEITAPQQLKAN